MTPRCKYCGELIYQFDDGPEWSPEGWARDETGDPVEDFICGVRETTARYPDGKPHEPDWDERGTLEVSVRDKRVEDKVAKPSVKLRRFISSNGEKQEFPAGTKGVGGTVSFTFEVEGVVKGLNEEQTKIVLQSVVDRMRMQMIQGEQSPEVVERTLQMKLPYLGTLLALANLDGQTLALLTE